MPFGGKIRLHQTKRAGHHLLIFDTLYKPTAVFVQGIEGTEQCPENRIELAFDKDENSQISGKNGEIISSFRRLTEDIMLRPFITENDFETQKGRKNWGKSYNFLIHFTKTSFVLLIL